MSAEKVEAREPPGTTSRSASGPLVGIRVVEMVGLGPAPFCSMMLADMGAEVIRIDVRRAPGAKPLLFDESRFDVLGRGRRSVALDLKKTSGKRAALQLIARADALVEGFRPGVMERLGLGPDVCLERNPKLVFGRITGWGQTGPLAHAAGHDLNYIALTGALYGIGRPDSPPPVPLNVIGDFGGGAMMLAFGVVSALLETQRSGRGQVIDAAMTEGTALLTIMIHALRASSRWNAGRGASLLDGGAPHYEVYVCSDGKYVAVGALEPKFYRLLLDKLGITDMPLAEQDDAATWPENKARLASLFATRTRDEWSSLLEGTDACFAPVLDWDEAPLHPHNRARETFVTEGGVVQPAPAPRFSRTPGKIQSLPAHPGADGETVLADWGLSAEEIQALKDEEAL